MIYSCPMHPEVKSKSPGICSICGMNLLLESSPRHPEAKPKDLGHETRGHGPDKHPGHTPEMFLKKFLVSLAITIPVLLIHFDLIKVPFAPYVNLALSSFIFFYGGLVFISGAIRELRAKLPGMMTLITVAISVAYIWSVFSVLLGGKEDLFWELTTLITVMLFGHYVEMRSISAAQSALKELSKLLPDKAELEDGTIITLDHLKIGDVVLVRPGAKVPADGEITDGEAEINESMMTGESKAVKKVAGNSVIAGTINMSGAVKVRITKMGENTFLAGIMKMVFDAQASKSRLQILSDKAALWLTYIAVGGGVITFASWMFVSGDFAFAIERLVAVVVIACPHALGMAVPLVVSISTTLGSKGGVLVRERLALEGVRNIDIVLFDKTGTLTEGSYGVDLVWPEERRDNILRVAAAVEQSSEHFAGKAIVEEARRRGLLPPNMEDFESVAGKGVAGVVDGARYFVGGRAIIGNTEISSLPADAHEKALSENRDGKTVIFVLKKNEFVGLISLSDRIRPESAAAVAALKEMGIRSGMVTGDTQNVASYVSSKVGLSEVFAEVLPADKANKVKALQMKGMKVAFVGDGINDAPALTQADVGIAIGAGTNVAIESAGIILVRSNPADIVKIVRLSRATYTKMLQNLFWATGYNVVALPLAAGVLAAQGILLAPALGALFMSLSTVIVAVNALLLRRIKLV